MDDEIKIEPTEDRELIAAMFLNPEIYRAMSDDTAPQNPLDLLPGIMGIDGFFLKVSRADKPCGIFWFRWLDNAVEVHTALLPSCRGIDAITAAKKAAQWVFKNTEADEITSYAWSDAPAVAWFCRALGMKSRNTQPWPNTRNGKSVDITYYSLKKGDT